MEEGAARKKRGDERVMKEKTWMKDEWMGWDMRAWKGQYCTAPGFMLISVASTVCNVNIFVN